MGDRFSFYVLSRLSENNLRKEITIPIFGSVNCITVHDSSSHFISKHYFIIQRFPKITFTKPSIINNRFETQSG